MACEEQLGQLLVAGLGGMQAIDADVARHVDDERGVDIDQDGAFAGGRGPDAIVECDHLRSQECPWRRGTAAAAASTENARAAVRESPWPSRRCATHAALICPVSPRRAEIVVALDAAARPRVCRWPCTPGSRRAPSCAHSPGTPAVLDDDGSATSASCSAPRSIRSSCDGIRRGRHDDQLEVRTSRAVGRRPAAT